ncbi:hypothetical protein ACFWIN_37060 [Streptomyces sp. NPDC127049]|uniref:hypothetical protein n=1 Tax=Streptomyces sp. NPDC127049 TaxID=3347118 RepID=UPI00364B8C66
MATSLRRPAGGGDAEDGGRPPGGPCGGGLFRADQRQGQIDPLDLAEPLLLLGPFATQGEVLLDLRESGQHLRVDLQNGAADAGMLVLAGRPVGASAVPELDLASIEVFLELGPLRCSDVGVFVVGTKSPMVVEVLLVVLEDVVGEDR